MDASEKLAEAYLKTLNFSEIKYEPDGNVPPDFLCDGRIAIEVRRLNQNFDDGTGSRGLEEVSIPLQKNMRALLASLGAPTEAKSWFVFYTFRRPLEIWKILKPKIEQELREFVSNPVRANRKIRITDTFSIRIAAATKVWTTYFLLGGFIDDESGGWLLEEIEKNLNLCIAEKTKKIEKFRHKYPEWWLIFSDQIAYGLDEFDKELFRDQVSIAHDFDRVVLIDPNDPARSVEVVSRA
jgi:hypothetical protein